MATTAKITVTFAMDKETKNTMRFAEQLVKEDDIPKIGTIYIPKETLSEIGWEEGKDISVVVQVLKKK